MAKLDTQKCRVEKTDIVPAGADLNYKYVVFSEADVASAYNSLVAFMGQDASETGLKAAALTEGTKLDVLSTLSPEAVEVFDTLTAKDIAAAINALMVERASAAQRIRAGVVKGVKKDGTTPKATSEEVEL